MTKKFKLLAVGLAIIGATGLAVSSVAFAQGTDDGRTTPANSESWEQMHEACAEGDWGAMVEAAKEVHGDDFGNMPCHDEDSTNDSQGMGSSMMGSGMMGGGMMSGGMMSGGMMGD